MENQSQPEKEIERANNHEQEVFASMSVMTDLTAFSHDGSFSSLTEMRTELKKLTRMVKLSENLPPTKDETRCQTHYHQMRIEKPSKNLSENQSEHLSEYWSKNPPENPSYNPSENQIL